MREYSYVCPLNNVERKVSIKLDQKIQFSGCLSAPTDVGKSLFAQGVNNLIIGIKEEQGNFRVRISCISCTLDESVLFEK